MTPDTKSLELLLDPPREDLGVELKSWLDLLDEDHRANFAKAVMAIANTGGGSVILGIDASSHSEAPGRPPNLRSSYSIDTISDIVKRYAMPAFQCQVHLVRSPNSGLEYPIVSVPGEQQIPIRCKRADPLNRHVQANKYYIRKPKPESIEVQDPKDWDDLIHRCVLNHRADLMSAIRGVIEGVPAQAKDKESDVTAKIIKNLHARLETLQSEGRFPKFRGGFWVCSYSINGEVELKSASDSLKVLAAGNTGPRTSVFDVVNRPDYYPEFQWYSYDGHAEQIVNLQSNDGFASRVAGFNWLEHPFCLASASPLLEDSLLYTSESQRARHSDVMWDVAEVFDLDFCLRRILDLCIHSHRIARHIGEKARSVTLCLRYFNMKGRTVVRRADGSYTKYQGTCHQNEISVGPIEFGVDSLRDNLVECVDQMFRKSLEPFGFLGSQIGAGFVAGEIKRLSERGVAIS